MKKKNRSIKFELFKKILRLFKRRPKFIFLGEKFKEKSLYLSNHAAASGPLTLELYFPLKFRFWGTYEMNDNFKTRFKYLSSIYFYQKKHCPKFLAFLISIPATPIMTMFYKGIRLISTYPDIRLAKTFKDSLNIIKNEESSIIIFPEDSSNGYFEKLKDFYLGFIKFAKYIYNNGIDLPIFLMYYHKKKNTIVVDNPILYSDIKENEPIEIAQNILNRVNELREFA